MQTSTKDKAVPDVVLRNIFCHTNCENSGCLLKIQAIMPKTINNINIYKKKRSMRAG
jgi:hypothetical protein